MKNLIVVILILIIIIGCSENVEKDKEELDNISKSINNDFISLVPLIDKTSSFIENLYSKGEIEKNLKKANKSNYKIADEGVMYKIDYTDSAAVFVSGFKKVDENIKNIVYFTEPLDKFFIDLKNKNSKIVQIYYNDKNSYNRIYPGFDVLTQYPSHMDIPSYNFYYLADLKHNPDKKAVWVKEPYVDPAGRGWMISLIKPIYINNQLEGVPGIDITIDSIITKYLGNNDDLVIISNQGIIVAISEKIASLLNFPPLKNHKYVETIKSDTYLPDNFNILKSKHQSVRELGKKLIEEKIGNYEFVLNDETFKVIASPIESLDWTIVKFIKE